MGIQDLGLVVLSERLSVHINYHTVEWKVSRFFFPTVAQELPWWFVAYEAKALISEPLCLINTMWC